MPLFVAQHQHSPESCPASAGSRLLSEISAAAVARHGVTIEAEALIDGGTACSWSSTRPTGRRSRRSSPRCWSRVSCGCSRRRPPRRPSSEAAATLNGSFSFSTTACLNTSCASLPNAYATGGGTYTIDDSSGNVLESGTLVADNTAGTSEGLVNTFFTDADQNVTSCSAAVSREVSVQASTSDQADPDIYIQAVGAGTTAVEGAFVATDDYSFEDGFTRAAL